MMSGGLDYSNAMKFSQTTNVCLVVNLDKS